ncbi:MAG: hypothetical protein M3410_12830 [Acidobacteriota bacterium]|nr:hypothetical protein [Acidobacteriota bacterium]
MRIARIPREPATRPCSATILLLAMLTVSVAGAVHPQEPRGRIIPPSGLKCHRNDLTVYDGKVLAYRRRRGSTFLRLRTNFDTTEAVTIRHAGTEDPSQFYLLHGEPFTRSDWRRIEKRRKVLKIGMRANVWVCRGNPSIQPVVDWRPDDTGGRLNTTASWQ